MRTFDGHNPDGEEDACGLTRIAQLNDPNASYTFDDIIVWKDNETGLLYMAQDSGCSCPTPFEGIKGLDDLTPCRSSEEFLAFVREHNKYDTWPQKDISAADDLVRAALK